MRQKSPDKTALRQIPLAHIDPPELPIRESFDPAALEELILSIQAVGVLQPIAVVEQGGRYRILAGHRRYIAAQRAGLATIPAVVRDTREVDPVAITSHENAFREDVNPAEEARYLAELLESRCDGDVDRLCELVRHKRAYVEGRLALLNGDPDVFEAVRLRRITMAVARELNRITDRGYRMMYLDAAIKGGATARLVQEWRLQCEAITPAEPPPPTSGENRYTGLPAPRTEMRCVCCDSAHEPWQMELIPIHRRCRGMFVDPHLARLRSLIRGPQHEDQEDAQSPTHLERA